MMDLNDTDPCRGSTAEELAAIFTALSDPTRVEMLRLLMAADEVACTTFDAVFPISKSTISYHVRELRHAGLIRVRKEGKFYYYTLLRDQAERRLPGLLTVLESIRGESSAPSAAPLPSAPEPGLPAPVGASARS